MTDNVLKTQAFKLKGRLYTLTVLHLLQTDITLFEQQLADVIASAPRLFDKSPVVLDCSTIPSEQLDLQACCQCMREHGMIPVALQGGTVFLNTLAQAQGLAILHGSSSHDKVLLDEHHELKSLLPKVESIKTKLFLSPVRSGQQVVSKGSDLVVMAPVSHGAELLADGNIHVYGALRGRALAGIGGDKEARIFCQSLDAELVSIAGVYRLSDMMEPVDVPCQIFLQGDYIQIEPL